jgi:hypothetical protein
MSACLLLVACFASTLILKMKALNFSDKFVQLAMSEPQIQSIEHKETRLFS